MSAIDIVASELRLGTPWSFAYGVAQWSNCPSASSVSGRMPSRTTARPRVVRRGVAISTRSPSAMPSAAAVAALTMTPRWPAMLSATSWISCIATLPPHAYCMLRDVSSQYG